MPWYDKILKDPSFLPKSHRFCQLTQQQGIGPFETYVGDPKLIPIAARLISQPETRRDGLEIIIGDYISANTIAQNSELLTAMSPTNLAPSKRIKAAIRYRRSQQA
jgi:hypothetical protein